MSYFKEFEFDLPTALLERLVSLFSDMTQGTLNDETVRNVDDAQGVYQLFFNNELVYVGKTDAEAGLKKRLQRHARKIRSRRNLAPEAPCWPPKLLHLWPPQIPPPDRGLIAA